MLLPGSLFRTDPTGVQEALCNDAFAVATKLRALPTGLSLRPPVRTQFWLFSGKGGAPGGGCMKGKRDTEFE